MRLRTFLLVPLVGLMGAGVVVLPALAASETTKLEVNQDCNGYKNWPCWTAPGSSPTYVSRITVPTGATITFADKAPTAADVVWRTAAPACSGVPTTSPESNWEGSCKFEAAGTYRFESSTLYSIYTQYEVVVGGGATGTTPTGTSTESTPTSTTPTTTTSSTTPTGSSTPTSVPGGSPSPLGSLFVGSAATALKLPGAQHGSSVHGSVNVSQAGAGGSLEVQLLASRAALASAGHAARAQVVGKVVRHSLRAGVATFTVSLDAAGRHALHTRGHLLLSVRLVLSSAQGATATLTRSVLIRS